MSLDVNPQPDKSKPASAALLLRTLLATAAIFGAAFNSAGLAFMAFAIFGSSHRPEPTSDLWGNFLMACYLTGISSALNTIAFVALVTCSVHWRRLSPLGAAARSAVFGVAAFLITMTGVQYHVLRVVPVMKLTPVLGVWLPYVLPGIFMGMLAVVAIWLASFWSKRKAHHVSECG